MFARSLKTQHHDIQNMTMRVDDPYADEGVWAIIDDGCNSCCFSKKWHQNAVKKWGRVGFQSYLKSSTPTSFTGVGKSTTRGKYVMPFGLKLLPSEIEMPGYIDAHMIEEGDHLLMLSQAVQAMLGMVKDVRDGTIQLKDYDGQHIEVARQIRTGLFIVRIDNLTCVEKYTDRKLPHACEALRSIVIAEDFPITNPEFLAKKKKDLYMDTASIATFSSSSTTVKNHKLSDEQIQARIDNIAGFTTDGYIVAQITGKNEAGLMNTEDASVTALPEIRKVKKAKLIKDRINATTLADLAAAEKQTVRTALGINMKNPTIAGAGAEPGRGAARRVSRSSEAAKRPSRVRFILYA